MESMKMFQKAAEVGHTHAMVQSPPLPTARQHMDAPRRTSCSSLSFVLQFNVGVYYMSTRGPAQSDTKAVEWFTKAAERGQVEAMANLGMCFMSGRGTEKDRGQARYWLDEAASKGNAQAKSLLAKNWQGEGLGSNKEDPATTKSFDKKEEEL